MLNSAARVLPSKKINCGQHGMALRGPDLYPSSPLLTEAFLAQSGYELPMKIWEPCAGKGDMAIPLRNAGYEVIASDLMDYGWDGLDFRQDLMDVKKAPPGCDLVYTNPPFGIASKLIRHALTLCNSVIVLNRLAFIEGKGRTDLIENHLTMAWPLSNRAPQMHRWSPNEDGVYVEWQGKKAPSAMPVCFFLLERHKPKYLRAGFMAKRISWRKSMIRLADAPENPANQPK